MITGRQVRAARALLGWDAEELAEKAGLSRDTIFNIEKGTTQARRASLEQLARVFEDHGLEFLDNQGVRCRPEGMEILVGEQGVGTFWDNVYVYAQKVGGVLRQNAIEDNIFFAAYDVIAKRHSQRMSSLKEKFDNLVVRVLMAQGVDDFQCPNYAQYRWFQNRQQISVPFYVYGDTVALFALDENSMTKIYQITSPLIAASYIKQFDGAWDAAALPGQTKLRTA